MKNQHNVYYSLDSQITKDFFDVIEDMLHKYYETRFKKKVLDVISVSEEEYYANETNKDPQLVVSFNGDNISYKEHMGLPSWRNAPDGKIVKADVSIAKNYLFGIGMAVHLICSLIFYRYEQKLEPARSN